MLRHIILNIHTDYLSFGRPAHQHFDPRIRDTIWHDWAIHFFSHGKDSFSRYSSRDELSFPALEKLTLDFTEWRLADNEGLFVRLAAPNLCGV